MLSVVADFVTAVDDSVRGVPRSYKSQQKLFCNAFQESIQRITFLTPLILSGSSPLSVLFSTKPLSISLFRRAIQV